MSLDLTISNENLGKHEGHPNADHVDRTLTSSNVLTPRHSQTEPVSLELISPIVSLEHLVIDTLLDGGGELGA